MSKSLYLACSMIFSLAAVFWGFNLIVADKTKGWPLIDLIVTLTFIALAAIYWGMFFRRQKNKLTGVE